MGNTLGEIETVIETMTNTTDPVDSVATLVDWLTQEVEKLTKTSTPIHAAVDLQAKLQANKGAIVNAILANTVQPQTGAAPAEAPAPIHAATDLQASAGAESSATTDEMKD